MSILKIISDANCSVRCDFQEVGNIQIGELFKLQLKKGCYILEFLVEDIVICSMDYTIETNDEEPLLRLNIKEQAEKKIREREFAYVYSEDGRSIIGCNRWFRGEFIVPEGIECIAGYAFRECEFTSIYIPNSVKSIGDYAFIHCSGLTSVKIPNSVTSIGEGAFSSCSGLNSITIGNSVTFIGISTLSGCSGLTSIVVEEGNTKYDSRNNCNAIIETSSNTLRVGCKNTTIPNSVTSIGVGAFQHCSSLTSIMIPNSVTSIGDDAFCDCSGLTSITIPNSVTLIGEDAFFNCYGLTSVTIPNSVMSIGHNTFACCECLTSVHISDIVAWCKIAFSGENSNPLELAHHLFLNGEELKDLVIPNSVTNIRFRAFSGCRGLTSITIPNSVTGIGDGAFEGCTDLTSVTIPNSVTSIGMNAFSGCSDLTSITIPNSVTSIGMNAFSGCSGLTYVTIGNNVIKIWDNAFINCRNLTTIVVEDGNAKYDSRNNCNAIIETSSNTLIAGCKNTTIPNSVTSIGFVAFLGCTELTSISIPNSVTSIETHAFSGCTGLTSISIPNSVTSIEAYAFSGCSGLTSITIPNSVTSIGDHAFSGCCGLTSVTIPNSVTSIGDYAFLGCSELTSISIPNRNSFLFWDCFLDCNNLKEIIIPKGTRAKFEEMLPDQKDKLVEQEQTAIKRIKDKILFFDTETTGVPLNYKAPSSDTNNWPRLVQLAWILTDEEGNRIHTGNFIIKPDGFVIPADAAKVHGITTQKAEEDGVSLVEAIEQFKADLDIATYIVGHNVDFDKKIVGAEMIRLGMKDELEKKKSYCTMQSSIDFCKIPGKYGYKYPKLQELYRKLFDEDFEDAHNAMSDIEATEKCFWELRKRKLV